MPFIRLTSAHDSSHFYLNADLIECVGKWGEHTCISSGDSHRNVCQSVEEVMAAIESAKHYEKIGN